MVNCVRWWKPKGKNTETNIIDQTARITLRPHPAQKGPLYFRRSCTLATRFIIQYKVERELIIHFARNNDFDKRSIGLPRTCLVGIYSTCHLQWPGRRWYQPTRGGSSAGPSFLGGGLSVQRQVGPRAAHSSGPPEANLARGGPTGLERGGSGVQTGTPMGGESC